MNNQQSDNGMAIQERIAAIKAMTNKNVLVTYAEETAEIPEEVPENWKWVAHVYKTYSVKRADVMIMKKLGDTHLLDPDTCRQMLIDEMEYGRRVDK